MDDFFLVLCGCDREQLCSAVAKSLSMTDKTLKRTPVHFAAALWGASRASSHTLFVVAVDETVFNSREGLESLPRTVPARDRVRGCSDTHRSSSHNIFGLKNLTSFVVTITVRGVVYVLLRTQDAQDVYGFVPVRDQLSTTSMSMLVWLLMMMMMMTQQIMCT